MNYLVLEFTIWYVQQQLTMESETADKRGLPCLKLKIYITGKL